MNISQAQILYQELAELPYDVKAEVAICQAIDNGLSKEDFIIFLNTFFEREYNKDIADAELIVDEWGREFLQLDLSRPGFYDLLPEGLFFQPEQKDYSGSAVNATEMAVQYRKDKAKEKEIRKFFRPFEHEFFYLQVMNEYEEVALLRQFNKPVPDIWDFPQALNRRLVHSFLLLLPYAHQIAGNIFLMEKAMQLMMGEKIKIVKKISPAVPVENEVIKLGYSNLGTDMICGDEFWEDSLMLEYKIGPLDKYDLSDFLNGGKGQLFIDNFNRFFAPLDADIQITIEIDKLHDDILLDTEDLPVLGYSTIL